MDDDSFWELLDGVPEADRLDGRMAPALSRDLAALPVPRIAEFHRLVIEKCDQLLGWELWEAAEIIHGVKCSEDTFCYFRLWLISQGKSTYLAAAANPDSLADHPHIQRLAHKRAEKWQNEDYPHMEDLLYVAEMAYDRVLEKLGPKIAARVDLRDQFQRRPRESPGVPMPLDFGEGSRIRRKYPGLIRLFSWPIDSP